VVITLKDVRTRRPVRSEYLRSGEILVMDRMPNGRYVVEYLQGINWSFTKTLSNGISRGGFLIDQKASKINKIFVVNNKPAGYIDCAVNGDLRADEISEEQFFN
jgi:hypothetical protein